MCADGDVCAFVVQENVSERLTKTHGPLGRLLAHQGIPQFVILLEPVLKAECRICLCDLRLGAATVARMHAQCLAKFLRRPISNAMAVRKCATLLP